MRIALLTHQFPGARLGGIGQYTSLIAQQLAQQGHDTHLFTFQLPSDIAAALPPHDNLTLHQVPPLAAQVNAGQIPAPFAAAVQRGIFLYRLALASLLCHAATREGPFDLIEGPEYEALALPLLSSSQPFITHLHSGSAIARHVGNLPADDPAELLWRERFELAAMACADAACAPTHQVIADTRNAYDQPRLLSNAQVLGLPLDLPQEKPTNPNPAGPLLYIGRLEWLKGTHVLTQAANVFLARNSQAQLRLVGPDTMTAPKEDGTPGNTSMLAWIKNHLAPEIASRVHFTGELNRAAIQQELQQASAIIVPSLRENFSYVTCESLAAGRPVIVSDQTGAAEVAANAGLTFARGSAESLAAAMEQLWNNPALSQHLAAARTRAAQLAAPDVLQDRINFYKTIQPQTSAQRLAKLQPLLPAQAIATIHAILQAIENRDAAALTTLIDQLHLPATPTPGQRLLKALDALAPTTQKFYLYGAGRHSERLLSEKSLWETHGHQLLGFIDDHPRFQSNPRGGNFFSLPVISLKKAAETLPPNAILILSTDAFEDQFWQQTAQLREKGHRVLRLYHT